MTIAETIEPKRHRRRRHQGGREGGGNLPDIIVSLIERLDYREKEAAAALIRDLQAPWGSSNSVTGAYQERVQTSIIVTGEIRGWTHAQQRFEGLHQKLSRLEKELLHFLVCNREYARKSLADFARPRLGYQDDKMNSAATVAWIKSLLQRVGDHYRVPFREPPSLAA